MRELTLTRQKALAACLAKYKVYIQDDLNGDTEINGINCRLLGTIKNGETVHFQIGEWEARLFVTGGGKISREVCNDSVLIPAGRDPVSYSGRGEYAPQLGNPFRFDGAPDAFAEANRKKKSGKRWAILIAVFLISLIAGVIVGLARNGFFNQYKEKTFTGGKMEITLDETFHEDDTVGFNTVLASKKVMFFYLTEEYLGSLDEYVSLFRESNGHSDYPLTENQKWKTYQFTSNDNGKEHRCFVYILPDPNGNAFHIFQFLIFNSDTEKYESKIETWMDSVKIGA